MKIDKKFLELLTGSLSKEKIEGESQEFESIFNIINKPNPSDNKIDIEEVTDFAAKIWSEDNGDGEISDEELEKFMQKNKELFKDTNIKSNDIKRFLEFFTKNSDKTQDNDKRVDNGDGTYSISTKREVYEEKSIIVNQDEIDAWKKKYKNASSSPKGDPKPKARYQKEKVLKGVSDRKITYDSDNKIQTIEETVGNETTVTDANGNLIRTIIKNEGAKDTIKEYAVLENGTTEESIYFGNDGIKDSEIPEYKNIYNKRKKLIARSVPDENGQFVQRQNMKNDVVTGVTKLDDNVEAEKVQLYTNEFSFDSPSKIADDIIDPTKQRTAGDHWLLNGLSILNKSSWGRQIIKDAVSVDEKTGNVTVKFKRAYGETQEFTFTPKELAVAQSEILKKYMLEVSKGVKISVDGEEELTANQKMVFLYDADRVKDNITFETSNGKEIVWSKLDLENSNYKYGQKYALGDKTVLAMELAVEKSREEAGVRFNENGNFNEVLALFTDVNKFEVITNSEIKGFIPRVLTESEKQDAASYSNAKIDLTRHMDIKNSRSNVSQLMQKFEQIEANFNDYICELRLKTSDYDVQTAQILRFEEKDDKKYIVYTHPWDDKAEITEELESFCKNTLYELAVIEKKDEAGNIADNSDSQIGHFKTSKKSNITNFNAAILQLSQNPEFKPDIQKEDGKFVVTIKGEKITITPNELETARVSGRYSKDDDDVSLLEIAVERYINKARHDNKLLTLDHTDLSDVEVLDILNLFSDKELTQQQYTSVGEASNDEGYKVAVRKKYDKALDKILTTCYSIKEIKQTPDGKYLITIVQPEDTTVTTTYTEEEFKNLFSSIEVYK